MSHCDNPLSHCDTHLSHCDNHLWQCDNFGFLAGSSSLNQFYDPSRLLNCRSHLIPLLKK